MNNRKYEIMEAHLKGELTVIDLIDRIVDLENAEYDSSIKPEYPVDEYVFDSRINAADVLEKIDAYARKYHFISVADYYDLIGVTPKLTDNNYGWSYKAVRQASVIPIRNHRYIIIFPPVEVI